MLRNFVYCGSPASVGATQWPPAISTGRAGVRPAFLNFKDVMYAIESTSVTGTKSATPNPFGVFEVSAVEDLL